MAVKKNSGYNLTLGNVSPRQAPSPGILSPECDLSYTVAAGYLSTENRHDLGHPHTYDYSSHSLPAVTHLGNAGGGHDDPSAYGGGTPGFVDPATAPPVKGGNLKIAGTGGHDDPSTRRDGNDGYPY